MFKGSKNNDEMFKEITTSERQLSVVLKNKSLMRGSQMKDYDEKEPIEKPHDGGLKKNQLREFDDGRLLNKGI